MTTLLWILLASAAYFAVMSREREAVPEALEDAGQLFLEVEPDEDGYHAVVLDVSDDSVLHVGNTYPTAQDAERAGQLWIAENE